MTTAGCSACACSSQNPRPIRRAPAAPAAPIANADYLAITAHDRGCEVWCLLRPLDAAKARVRSHRSRDAVERIIAPAAPRRWTGRLGCTPSERSSPSSPARSHGRGPCRCSAAVRSRTPWQSSGEPSSGGWPTLRASCATTVIGVRSVARPGSLSAVLGNECGNPIHDRVAKFRQTFAKCPPGRAIEVVPGLVEL